MVWGSSSSKLLSRLILLRFILRISISLQYNTILPESSLKQSIFWSAYIADQNSKPYTKTKKLKKRTVSNRLKFKKMFFIYTHDFQAQNFLIN